MLRIFHFNVDARAKLKDNVFFSMEIHVYGFIRIYRLLHKGKCLWMPILVIQNFIDAMFSVTNRVAPTSALIKLVNMDVCFLEFVTRIKMVFQVHTYWETNTQCSI